VYFAAQQRWFDRWLKDIATGVEADAPVRIFVMGGGDGRRTRDGRLNHGGRWRDEQEWPLARTQYTTYYLHADGTLSDAVPTAGTREFTYDPSHPVPTIGASSSGLMELIPLGDGLDPFWGRNISPWLRLRSIVLEGAAHQKEEPGMVGARPPYLPLAMRPDVLVFTTPPLALDTELTGEILVKLWISSSAEDTDFTAKLVDVYPPNTDFPEGYHLNLSDSIIRCRYRGGWDHEELMTPGEIYAVQISLAPTSNLFKAGHYIRLDVSSSNFPRFDLNPNTGEPMGRHTRSIRAHNTVYFASDYPSQVVFPLIVARL